MQEVLDPDDQAKRCDLLLALGEALILAGSRSGRWTRSPPRPGRWPKGWDDEAHAARVCQLALFALSTGGTIRLTTPAAAGWVERAERSCPPGDAGARLGRHLPGASSGPALPPPGGGGPPHPGAHPRPSPGGPGGAELLRECFDSLGRQLGLFSQMSSRSRDELKQLIESAGWENLDDAKADHGKKLVLYTGHLGAWELTSFGFSLFGQNLRSSCAGSITLKSSK